MITTTEPIKPPVIDWCVWVDVPEKPGYVRVKTTKSIKAYAQEVKEAFDGLYPDSLKYSCSGHFEHLALNILFRYEQEVRGWKHTDLIPEDAIIFTYCNRGGSEGWYVYLRMEANGREPIDILMGKCFDKDWAWVAARQLAEICGVM